MHVALLAGRKRSGEPVHEVVPATLRPDGTWQLLGTPALAAGCAGGDVVSVDDNGRFDVVRRRGNVAVVAYASAGLDVAAAADDLRARVTAVPNGRVATVETDPRGRWLVATVPAAVGFPTLETVLQGWRETTGADWAYGNVHDETGEPLGWW